MPVVMNSPGLKPIAVQNARSSSAWAIMCRTGTRGRDAVKHGYRMTDLSRLYSSLVTNALLEQMAREVDNSGQSTWLRMANNGWLAK
jgi:hypothetical protein